MHLTTTISAGQRLEFIEDSDFFRLMAATAPVSVQFYYQGREVAEAVDVGAGYAERFLGGRFDRVVIDSATAQTIQIATRLGNEVRYDTPPVGNVAITNVNGAFAQFLRNVGTTSTNILSANAARRYVLVQNKDASSPLYLSLIGTTPTVANGLLIPPGGSLEIQGFVPTAQINAISTAANPNVVVVEG